jgi:hypothetical protein
VVGGLFLIGLADDPLEMDRLPGPIKHA